MTEHAITYGFHTPVRVMIKPTTLPEIMLPAMIGMVMTPAIVGLAPRAMIMN